MTAGAGRRAFWWSTLKHAARLSTGFLNNAVLLVIGLAAVVGVSVTTSVRTGLAVLALILFASLVEGAFRTWRDAVRLVPPTDEFKAALAAIYAEGHDLCERLRKVETDEADVALRKAADRWYAETDAWISRELGLAASQQFRHQKPTALKLTGYHSKECGSYILSMQTLLNNVLTVQQQL